MTDQETWNEAPATPEWQEDEWREVEAESQIVLEVEGDGFQGRFMGMDPRNANGIIQGHWTSVTTLDHEHISDTAFMNVTRDLENKLKKVPVKAFTRIQWVSSMDTGHESGNKMRVFKVQWR
jgi:hypothetical protein